MRFLLHGHGKFNNGDGFKRYLITWLPTDCCIFACYIELYYIRKPENQEV